MFGLENPCCSHSWWNNTEVSFFSLANSFNTNAYPAKAQYTNNHSHTSLPERVLRGGQCRARIGRRARPSKAWTAENSHARGPSNVQDGSCDSNIGDRVCGQLSKREVMRLTLGAAWSQEGC